MRIISLDIETRDRKVLDAVVWSVTMQELNRKPLNFHDCMGMKSCPREVKQAIEDPDVLLIVHNGGDFDLPIICLRWGVRLRCKLWDTMWVETVIQGRELPPQKKENRSPAVEQLYKRYGTALDYVLVRYGLPVPDKTVRAGFIDRPFGIPFTKTELKYMHDDVTPLLALQRAQEIILRRDGELEVALLENETARKVAQMRMIGLGVNKTLWMEIADKNLREYRKQLSSLPSGINWNSPAQVKKFFTARGTALASFEELETTYIKTRDPLLGKFIKIRQMYADTTSYGAKWLYRKDGSSTVDKDGRIRCSWLQVKDTGRFSSNDPNVLALPKEGLQRSAIVPARGNVFVIGDFSGQEIGIMAAASKEDFWIDALLRGEDIHALMASIVTPTDWVKARERGCTFPKKCQCKGHKKLREPAKINNFLLAYGGGAGKLIANMTEALFERPGMPSAEDLDAIPTPLEARVFVRKHTAAIRRLAAYLARNAASAKRDGVAYSADPYKRRRVLDGQQDWQIENQGRNHPIQSAGANMLKLSMISMPDEFPIVLPFHDEICCEVPKAKGKKCLKVLKDVMEKSADYITGIKGLIQVKPRIATNFMKE